MLCYLISKVEDVWGANLLLLLPQPTLAAGRRRVPGTDWLPGI